VKLLSALLIFLIAGCASRYEKSIDQHFRHHDNTEAFERLQREGAEAEAERRCGGAVELIAGKDGIEAKHFKCAPRPVEKPE
jgi:hypothetical protein